MSDKIIVPTLGESVTEATVSKWLKNQGEAVSMDEPVVELETDKVNVEVPAPSNGILENISVKEGETVNVGALLGVINGSTKNISESVKEVKDYSPPKKQTQTLKNFEKEVEKKPKVFKEEKEVEPLILNDFLEEKKEQEQEKAQIQKQISPLSPAARKMATEAKIDLDNISFALLSNPLDISL